MLGSQELEGLCNSFISKSYVSQGVQELRSCSKDLKTLLSQRGMPKQGWSEAMIERLLSDLALMDSNSFRGNAGVGEREGRIACPMVARRNYRLSHGIGRSGDIAAEQPKAAGSSLLTRITHFLVLHALKLAGLQTLAAVQVFPVATGMAMTLAFLACAAKRPQAKYIIWSRIDQKTCLKSMVAANLTPVVVPLLRQGDELQTDLDTVRHQLETLRPENVACIVTTTSCFAPRACDNVEEVAKLCHLNEVPHVINNAYGVQSTLLAARVTRACRVGRVDVVIQSTDKNFLVPVGGAVAAAPGGQEGGLLREMASRYPGRAGVSAHLDLLMTLLHMGQEGWLEVLREREELFEYAKGRLQEEAQQLGERLLTTPGNPISLALTVDSFSTHLHHQQQRKQQQLEQQETPQHQQVHSPTQQATQDKPCSQQQQQLKLTSTAAQSDQEGSVAPNPPSSNDTTTQLSEIRHTKESGASPHKAPSSHKVLSKASSATVLGAMLWQRHVSGVRLICRDKTQSVAGIQFHGYGSSCDDYPHDYMTAAAALGASRRDIDVFIEKVKKCWLSEA